MNNSWPKTTLEEVCIRITDGAHASPKSVVSGLPMASVKDLTQFGINMETCRHISTDDFNKLVRQGCKPEVGDILISKDGASALDTVCEIRHELNVVMLSSVAILKPNRNKITSSFLHYFLDCETTRQYLKNGFITGAAIPRVILKDFKRCEIALPPLPTQHKIAAILSAYDDLIENNTRRIKILEEMAQALYREWFVKFRFPGHEKVRMVGSELGMVPEGWEITQLNNFIILSNGKSIKPGGNGQYIVYGSNGIIGGSDEYNYENGIIIGRVGAYCGSIKYCRKRFWASDNTIVALPKKDSPDLPFIFHLLLEMELNKYAGGAAQPLLTQTTLKKLQIVVPPDDIRRKYDSFVENLLAQLDNLTYKNTNLRRTRDLLLPKLISGEVDVEKLDINIPRDAA